MKKIVTAILIGLLLIVTFNPSTSEVKATANDWWDPAWEYRKEITIDHDMVDADFLNFPILFHNTSSNFTNHTQSNGDDFAFVSSDGRTQYNHEIESYDSITGELIAWVNINSLSSTIDTIFYLYYGNPSCSSQENVEETWDSNFVAVWHMNDKTTNSISDSTTNDNDGTKYGTNKPIEVEGKVNKGQLFDGVDNYIQIETDSSIELISNFTISLYFNQNVVTSDKDFELLGKWNISNAKGWGLRSRDNKLRCGFRKEGGSNYDGRETDSFISTNMWYHTALSYIGDGSEPIIYVNGSSISLNNWIDVGDALNGTTDSGDPFWIGRNHMFAAIYQYFNGSIDEVRLSSIVRDDSWIKTSYNTMNNPDTFLSVSSEQWFYGDYISPTVQITQPELGFLYVNLLEYPFKIPVLLPFATIIIGKIEVRVKASDKVGIQWVKFYIDDDLQTTKKDIPYYWTWNKQTVIFPYTLKVCACDFSGNKEWAEIKVWRMQLFQYN